MQNLVVISLLNFYIRGLSSKITTEQQGSILNLINDNCITIKSTYVMCHVNQVFFVTTEEKVKNLPTIQTQGISEAYSYNDSTKAMGKKINS